MVKKKLSAEILRFRFTPSLFAVDDSSYTGAFLTSPARDWYSHEASAETWSVRTFLGILLCADTDEDIAKYSILHGNEKLFATRI